VKELGRRNFKKKQTSMKESKYGSFLGDLFVLIKVGILFLKKKEKKVEEAKKLSLLQESSFKYNWRTESYDKEEVKIFANDIDKNNFLWLKNKIKGDKE
jgi:hypothetical protein